MSWCPHVLDRRSKRLALIAAIAATLAAWAPTLAAAQETEAANCPGPRDAYVSPGDPQRYAQTFVPSLTGSLTRAEIDYQEQPGVSGDLLIQILAVDGTGTPTDTVLAETTLPDLPDSTETTLTAVFSSPASVVEGQSYALALSRPGAGAGAFAWGYRSGDPCPGRFFINAGGAWHDFSSFGDLVFSVFVTPRPLDPEPEPTPEPEPQAGDGSAPDTVITSGPKKRSTQKTSTFEFTSTEAGSTFECRKFRIDKPKTKSHPFVPCTSAKVYKLAWHGNRLFEVRATDAAGNVDATPAVFGWKVAKLPPSDPG